MTLQDCTNCTYARATDPGENMTLPDRLQAAILYIQLRGRLDDVSDDVVTFIRGNLSTDDRLHLWAFMLGKTGVRA